MTATLFETIPEPRLAQDVLGSRTAVLNGFALEVEAELVSALKAIVEHAPFRQMVTPSGFRMSIAMSNCRALGWVTDRTGYRYDGIDPETGFQWPAMPPVFLRPATDAAKEGGLPLFLPDACLINRYEPCARLSLHQD
jgi:alkylated DNA repair protein (DNA oxidative demethylase)